VKLQQISTFVVVYQERSFTAAAERIHATQSGLSMQIKELEDTLGLQLFERSTRGVEPTAAGERFYAHALRLLRELDEARVEMRAMKGQETGTVTAGLMPTFSRAALSPAVAEYTASHPYVNLKIVEAYSAVLTDRVAREELDLAIVPPVAADARLRSSHVARDHELFVTSARSKRRHLEPVSMADVGPLRLILPTRGNARRARLDDYLKGVGATVEAVLEMDAMMGTLELIATSDWVSILPATLCYPDIEPGPRCLHPIVHPPLSVDYVLVTPSARTVSPAATAFAEVLSRHIRLIGKEWDRHFGHQRI
jgi:LysR family transcriptional regulator, nitrogen assimilation regulatory protein